jgi:hypothetical protein
MKSFADKVLQFNKSLDFKGKLPKGISIMNPFREDKKVNRVASQFYKKYYDDNGDPPYDTRHQPRQVRRRRNRYSFHRSETVGRKMRHPFHGELKHEPSSVFIYEMIDAFGGAESFYKQFYINSICPLGFTATNARGKEVNYNYYDSKELIAAVYDFMCDSISKQIAFGIDTGTGFCFGTGKNEKFLRELNEEKKYFKNIVALEHPRFIVQYKSKTKQDYIDKYVSSFRKVRQAGLK